jgi:hypothetical protein
MVHLASTIKPSITQEWPLSLQSSNIDKVRLVDLNRHSSTTTGRSTHLMGAAPPVIPPREFSGDDFAPSASPSFCIFFWQSILHLRPHAFMTLHPAFTTRYASISLAFATSIRICVIQSDIPSSPLQSSLCNSPSAFDLSCVTVPRPVQMFIRFASTTVSNWLVVLFCSSNLELIVAFVFYMSLSVISHVWGDLSVQA